MNKIILRSISLSLSLCLFSLLSAQVLLASQDIYTSDNTLKRVLDNGMTVVIHEVYKTPITSIYIMVETGSATEGRFSGSGISHCVEHMLFKSGGKKQPHSYNERIKSLGGYTNGFTSHDYTGYTITVPSEYVVEALKILKDIVAFPSFDRLELMKEKEVILEEIRRNKDDNARSALDLSWELIFKEHPYKYPIIGHEDLFGYISKKEVEQYYATRYSPHNMILVISGNVRRDELFRKIDEIYGPLKRNFVPSLSTIHEPLQLNPRRRVEYRAISLAHVVLSYKSASINDTALYPLDILAVALGEGENSILTKELRDKRKLVHYIRCQNYTLRDSGLFYIYFTASHSKVNDAIAAILEQLKIIEETGMGEDDLKRSKKIAEAGFANTLETAEGRARDISISEVIANDYNFTQIYLRKLLDVTTEEVKSTAKTYLKKNYLNTVLILPEEGKEAATLSTPTPQFSRKILKRTMPNGMSVLVCEDRSTPLCSMSALFLGGVRAENSTNNGITYLVSKLLLDGTTKRSESDIKSEIESKGGRVQSISGNNSFGLKLRLFSEDWRSGIEIMSDVIMNSVFHNEKIEKEKALATAAIHERDDNIVSSGLLLFKQNFYEKHPYRLDSLGKVDDIQNLKRDDMVRHYKSLCVPANMVFTIAGDINTNEVITEIKKRFGAFEATEPKLPNPPIPTLPKNKKNIFHSMEREESLIIVGFPSVKLTGDDRYIFEVIDSIMSGSDGRMYSNIRDRLGMTYALGSFFMPGLEPGYHIFYALTSRQNVEVVKEAILKEIKILKDKIVPEEELEAVKRYLIASTMAELQKNETFTLKISLDELYGLGYDNFQTYNAKINSVTASQVKRVANQYFDMEHSLIVIIRGKEAKDSS